MTRNFSKTAFTLIELIVALVLVSVIVLGIFSVSMVLTNNSQDYGQRYSVRSQTQTTLNHILNNASLAVGSAANVGSASAQDQGIVINQLSTGANSNTSFCIHQQNQTAPVSVIGSNPSTDFWICYTWDNTVADGNSYKTIYYCYLPYNINSASRGASGNCAYVAFPLNPEIYLGTAFVLNPVPTIADTAANFSTNTPGQVVFSIGIQNCLSDTAASCYNATPSLQDPVNNPQVSVSGSVTPSQYGMLQT